MSFKRPKHGLEQADLEYGETIEKYFPDIKCEHNFSAVPAYRGQLIFTNYKVIFKPVMEFGQDSLAPNVA